MPQVQTEGRPHRVPLTDPDEEVRVTILKAVKTRAGRPAGVFYHVIQGEPRNWVEPPPADSNGRDSSPAEDAANFAALLRRVGAKPITERKIVSNY